MKNDKDITTDFKKCISFLPVCSGLVVWPGGMEDLLCCVPLSLDIRRLEFTGSGAWSLLALCSLGPGSLPLMMSSRSQEAMGASLIAGLNPQDLGRTRCTVRMQPGFVNEWTDGRMVVEE